MLVWQSIPIFIFIWLTLPELFGKTDKWWRIYKNKQHQLFINQTMCVSKFMCQEEIKFSFAVAMRASFHKKDVSL